MLPCPKCSYLINVHAAPQCPECGSVGDLLLVNTARLKTLRRMQATMLALLGALIVPEVVNLARILVVHGMPGDPISIAFVIGFGALCITGILCAIYEAVRIVRIAPSQVVVECSELRLQRIAVMVAAATSIFFQWRDLILFALN